jgi:UDP-N-acetylmuramoyl-L-alanyl-D-glutamate--2,6-diaminopimelate ligase
MDLLEDIAAGCGNKERGKDLFLIPDRAMAIRQAFKLATEGDTVLLLGKGHENSIIYASGTISWDEISEAYAALAEAGYERKHP